MFFNKYLAFFNINHLSINIQKLIYDKQILKLIFILKIIDKKFLII